MKKYVALTLLALLTGAAVIVFEGDFDAAEVDAKYTNAESEFFTDLDCARIHYRDQGNAAGEPLVLVHGSNASLHTWEPWIQRIGATFRVITLDLPAHGLTGAVPNAQYDSAAQLTTVEQLLQHLQVPQFILGGNSMGGGVSWRYALAHPDQVSALILLDASGPRAWRSDQAPQQEKETTSTATNGEGPLVFRLLQKPWFRRIARYLDTRYLTEQGLGAAFHDNALVTDDMVDLYYDMSMRAGTREATLQRFTRRSEASQQVTDRDLAMLTVPTLILWGETDTLIPATVGERFAATLPNSKLIVYPNVGHLPMEEIAEQSALDLLDFLSQRPAQKRTTGF